MIQTDPARTHRHGLTFFSNISSSSAAVRLEVSGMTKNAAMHMGSEMPAKKKHVLRPLWRGEAGRSGRQCAQQLTSWPRSC